MSDTNELTAAAEAKPETLPMQDRQSTSKAAGKWPATLSSEVRDQLLVLTQYREALGRCNSDQERQKKITELQVVLEQLSGAASAAGIPVAARLSGAIDAFLRELCAKPIPITGSNLRTLALAFDSLTDLLQQPSAPSEQNRALLAVVLDDQHVTQTAARLALSNAGLESKCFSAANETLEFLAKNSADLVVLDMRFTELYDDIRKLPLHGKTPTIFVAGKVDEQFATLGNESDETQILTKPCNVITYLELALKGLTRVLRRQAGLGSDTTHTPQKKLTNSSLAKEEPPSVTPVHELDEVTPEQPKVQQLEDELAAIKKTVQILNDDLALEREVVAELTKAKEQSEASLRDAQALTRGESSDFERRLRESASTCARLTTELEQERAERRRVEQRAAALGPQLQALHEQLIQHLGSQNISQERIDVLEKQIREGNESLQKLTAEIEKERSEHKLTQEQLQTSGELCSQLRNCLSSFDQAKKGYKKTNDELHARLVSTQNAAKEFEAKLQKEASERQRLQEALVAAQVQLQEQAEQHSLEVTGLQAALEAEQTEQKRREVEAIQVRFASLDSARANLANANKFRRQIQEPLQSLIQDTRKLLEVPLEADAKQLVQSMLENAIFLEGNVQEIGKSNSMPVVQESPSQPVALEQPAASEAGSEKLAA